MIKNATASVTPIVISMRRSSLNVSFLYQRSDEYRLIVAPGWRVSKLRRLPAALTAGSTCALTGFQSFSQFLDSAAQLVFVHCGEPEQQALPA
jgi:hypothetical protein